MVWSRLQNEFQSMTTLTLQEVQSNLTSVLQQLQPGEEILIVDQGQPLARMQKAERTSWPCQAGTAKGSITWIAPDFDAPLEEFREYME
jgi:antitoxin (DNA-binding transcriptional repressor) of toxin-antitoxin stability system